MRIRRPGVLSSLLAGAALALVSASPAVAAENTPAGMIEHEVVYEGAHLDFRTATLDVAGRSHVVPVKPVSQWEEDCPGPDSIGGTCNLHARLTLHLTDAAMKDLAAAWPQHGQAKLRVRFEDSHGNAVAAHIPASRISGLVEVHGSTGKTAS